MKCKNCGKSVRLFHPHSLRFSSHIGLAKVYHAENGYVSCDPRQDSGWGILHAVPDAVIVWQEEQLP